MDDNEQIDYTQFAADFANEFKGGTGEPLEPVGTGEPPAPPSPPTPPAPPPPSPAPIDPIAQIVPDIPLPKSWKKETEAVWAKADPEVRKHVAEREAQMSRGIQMYQQGYTAWDAVTKPFAEALKQYPNFGQQEQVQLYQNLMGHHLSLLGPQKVETARKLLQAYGIDAAALAGTPGAPPPPAAPVRDPRVDTLEQTLNGYLLSEQQKIVNAFFSDPKNSHAEELAPEIVRLLETGQAKDLQSAYEQAQWLNPTVRQKLIDGDIAERTRKAKEEADKARGLKKLNKGSSDEPGTPPAKKGSVDDTIAGVLEKYTKVH